MGARVSVITGEMGVRHFIGLHCHAGTGIITALQGNFIFEEVELVDCSGNLLRMQGAGQTFTVIDAVFDCRIGTEFATIS
jgi:hypothetical protein